VLCAKRWFKACRQWASTVYENQGKKANKVEALERGFLNHPVRKLVCIAGAADRARNGTLGRGDVKSENAVVPFWA